MSFYEKSERFLFLEEKYKDFLYCEDKNNTGNIIIVGKNIKIKKLKHKIDEILEYITYICFHSLNISSKYKKNTYIIHVYVDGWSIENFSLKIFKYLNDNLKDVFEDVLEVCYIYNKSKIFKFVYNMIYKFIDPETRPKIKYINS